MFTQVAQKVKEVVKNSRCEYKTVIGNKSAAIHPGSVLFQRKPYAEAIVYTISFYLFYLQFLNQYDMVYSTKEYFRCVTAIESGWLHELLPEWFS